MRRSAVLVVAVLALGMSGCFLTEWLKPSPATGTNAVQDAGAAVAAVAPALPGPLGGIVAGGATLLTLLGGFFAGRKKAEAYAEGGVKGEAAVASLSPVTKLFAERKWLMPMVSAVIAGGNAANLWHIDTEQLLVLLGSLNVPAVMEFMKDGKTIAAKA